MFSRVPFRYFGRSLDGDSTVARGPISNEHLREHRNQGFVLVKQFFEVEEVELLGAWQKWSENSITPLSRSGRGDHVLSVDQARTDTDRVKEILTRLPLTHVEMDPGDILFFDCNLLHRSDQNLSENPRSLMICCYNAARNDPYKESHHPRYTPLTKVVDSAIVDSAIKEAGLRRFADSRAKVAWPVKEKDGVRKASLQ